MKPEMSFRNSNPRENGLCRNEAYLVSGCGLGFLGLHWRPINDYYYYYFTCYWKKHSFITTYLMTAKPKTSFKFVNKIEDLRLYDLFNSISVISVISKAGHEKPVAGIRSGNSR